TTRSSIAELRESKGNSFISAALKNQRKARCEIGWQLKMRQDLLAETALLLLRPFREISVRSNQQILFLWIRGHNRLAQGHRHNSGLAESFLLRQKILRPIASPAVPAWGLTRS